MSNKQEATWHDGGEGSAGRTRMAVTEDPAFGASVPAQEEAGPRLSLASTRELLDEVGRRGMEAVHDNPDINTEGLHLANLMVFAVQVFSDEVLRYRPWETR